MAIIKWALLETPTLLRIKSTKVPLFPKCVSRVDSMFLIHLLPSIKKKHLNQTSTAVNVEQTPRINRKVKHPSTNIKEGHSGEKTISVASLQACSEIHLFGQTGRAFTTSRFYMTGETGGDSIHDH